MTDRTLDRLTIGRWLAVWAASLFLLVLIGGGTRLTESGLSITEWNPVSGVVPPLSDASWDLAFEKYKQIPQYAQRNSGMSLGAFKSIYWWEFLHRFWARLVGVVFAVPLVWLAARRRIPRSLLPRLAALGILMGLQGVMGWYMVASGLTERVSVSQYRLAAHLSLALVIYLVTVWTADGLTSPRRADSAHPAEVRQRLPLVRRLQFALGLAFVTAVSGAFVAGLRAGKIYNEFPLMGAGVVPAEYGTMGSWWRNAFENPAAAQFHHRVLAILMLVVAIGVWFSSRTAAWPALRTRLALVLAAALIQVTLGITALLLVVPVVIGIAHQAGALFLLTTLVVALREASAT